MSEPLLSTKHYLRFSILNLLLLTAIVALSIMVAMLWYEIGPLRNEVLRLRSETGVLTISDPALAHAIRVETVNDREWKWRVWIPIGSNYRLHCKGQKIPGQSFPPATHGGPLVPGEHILWHQFYKSSETGEWEGKVVIRCVNPATTRTGSFSIESGRHDWLDWKSTCAMTGGISYETESFKGEEPIILIRHRVDKEEVGSSDDQKTPGVMIWLEPQ